MVAQKKNNKKTRTLEDVKKIMLKRSKELGNGIIKGFDFNETAKGLNADDFIDSFKDTGLQATNLGRAIEVAKKMRADNAQIFLGFTSNIGTSGLRDIITYLCKHKMVHFLVTTTGGLEEDIIKTHGDFLHGSFDADGAFLRDNGVNRTGNIFIPNERYIWFEQFMQTALTEMHRDIIQKGKILDSVEFVKKLGSLLEGKEKCETSFTYWCHKNNIPLLCVPLADGAIGDHIYMFKKEHRDFSVDLCKEVEILYDTVLGSDKTGAILLGGSVPKHHIMNAFMIKEGVDYAIYINDAYEGDGSNAGANIEDAKSWGKAASGGEHAKIWGEASIIFPLLIAGAFRLDQNKTEEKKK
jgi:deoxyhypusine synthase